MTRDPPGLARPPAGEGPAAEGKDVTRKQWDRAGERWAVYAVGYDPAHRADVGHNPRATRSQIADLIRDFRRFGRSVAGYTVRAQHATATDGERVTRITLAHHTAGPVEALTLHWGRRVALRRSYTINAAAVKLAEVMA